MKYGCKYIIIICLTLIILCCGSNKQPVKHTTETIVFKHGKIAGDPVLFQRLLDKFEKEHPGIKVKDEILPASTDEQHQFYVINLEGKSADFDVLSMDVIWVPEFARAGWLTDLSCLFKEEERENFFPGPVEAVTYKDKIYAAPWYIDAGILYYRKDLLEKYGCHPPETWYELVETAKYITAKEKDLYGFIWQGKQYEGLVCNVLEYFRGNGGEVLKKEKSSINSCQNIEAITFMRDLITKYKVSPSLVTTAMEESTRHIFGNGRSLFMRNWPYAWNMFEKEGSPVKGKVGVSALPSFLHGKSASTLGGWQLGINRFSGKQAAAEKLILFLISEDVQKTMVLTIGYKPTRKSLYKDRELIEKQPFITGLYDVFMKAKPRPVTAYYMMITQVMQPEFSAAISGIKTPKMALDAANTQIEHILTADK